jgi:hypothetical protein
MVIMERQASFASACKHRKEQSHKMVLETITRSSNTFHENPRSFFSFMDGGLVLTGWFKGKLQEIRIQYLSKSRVHLKSLGQS